MKITGAELIKHRELSAKGGDIVIASY